jgi:hypothetical protein
MGQVAAPDTKPLDFQEALASPSAGTTNALAFDFRTEGQDKGHIAERRGMAIGNRKTARHPA